MKNRIIELQKRFRDIELAKSLDKKFINTVFPFLEKSQGEEIIEISRELGELETRFEEIDK